MSDATGTKMEQRSAETRGRIVRAAYDLFCGQGFRATTMESIAAQAGVSVQTVYFQFRTKSAVLKAVHEWTVLGDTPLPPAMQRWHVAAMQQPDARAALAKVVGGVAALNARIAPTLPVFNALALDPDGEIYRQSKHMRRRDMRQLVDGLRAKTPLREGLTPARAADLLDFLMGPESYAALVLDAGWSRRQWTQWVAGSLSDQLFGPAGRLPAETSALTSTRRT